MAESPWLMKGEATALELLRNNVESLRRARRKLIYQAASIEMTGSPTAAAALYAQADDVRREIHEAVQALRFTEGSGPAPDKLLEKVEQEL